MTAETSNARGELRMADIRADARAPLQLLRERLCNNEEGWSALCQLMPMLTAPPPAAAQQQGQPVAYIHPDSISALTLAPEGAWLRVFTRGKQPPPDGWTPVYTAPPSAPKAQPLPNGVIQRHVVTKFSDGSTRVEDVLTAPSAPVGVEDVVMAARNAENAIRNCAAAGQIGEGYVQYADDLRDAVQRLAQQPAAVDGADAKLALANDISSVFGNTNKAMTDHLWSLGYRKVAAQHQEPTT
jgi:hypothetical protein